MTPWPELRSSEKHVRVPLAVRRLLKITLEDAARYRAVVGSDNLFNPLRAGIRSTLYMYHSVAGRRILLPVIHALREFEARVLLAHPRLEPRLEHLEPAELIRW